MDSGKRLQLRDALEQALDSDTRGRAPGSQARLDWIVNHLVDYVDRWLGLLRLPDWPWDDIIEHDSFSMIEIGAAVLTRELAECETSTPALREWAQFLTAVDRVKHGGGREVAGELDASIRKVRQSLQPLPAGVRWLPIRFRDFYDFPRAFVVQRDAQYFFFRSPSASRIDNRPPHYRVYLLNSEGIERLEDDSWKDLEFGARLLGEVPVHAVRFDPTQREFIDGALLDSIWNRTTVEN